MAKKRIVTAEEISIFMRKLEELAAEATEIMESAKGLHVEGITLAGGIEGMFFDIACATRDIMQMSITVSGALYAKAVREKTENFKL